MVYVVLFKNFYYPHIFLHEQDAYNYIIDQFAIYLKSLGKKIFLDKYTFDEFYTEEYEIRKFLNIDSKKPIYIIQDGNFKVTGDIITNDSEVWKKQVSNNSQTYMEICTVRL